VGRTSADCGGIRRELLIVESNPPAVATASYSLPPKSDSVMATARTMLKFAPLLCAAVSALPLHAYTFDEAEAFLNK